MVKIVYTGMRSKLRHRGRTNAEYIFHRGQPVVIDDKTDAKFFIKKTKKNPATWKVYEEPAKKASKKDPAEEPPEEEAPAEEEKAEETPKEKTPEEEPKPKAPAKKEAEK